jgi:DNA end-binding protein Ku
MRAIWSGAISFGLVNIPVKLYTGAQSNSLDLDMITKDGTPIKYLRVNKETGREVPYEDIVKGYKMDGEYVILDKEDFAKANVEKTNTIDIVDFVDEDEIDIRYFEKPYYLEPEKSGAKPYVLLIEALKKSKKVGVAKFVLRNREHIAVIKPYKDVIVLNQMRYQEELRDYNDLKLPKGVKVSDKEVNMALSLIEQLTDKFKPQNYKDTYIDDLKKIIDDKAHGRKIKVKGKEPKPTKAKDLMTLLKRSIEEKKKSAA